MHPKNKIRFLHCIMSDGVVRAHRESKQYLDRTSLDIQHSSERARDLHKLFSDQRNELDFVPESKSIGGLNN